MVCGVLDGEEIDDMAFSVVEVGLSKIVVEVYRVLYRIAWTGLRFGLLVPSREGQTFFFSCMLSDYLC